MAIRMLDLTKDLPIITEEDYARMDIDPFRLSPETIAEIEAIEQSLKMSAFLARFMLVD